MSVLIKLEDSNRNRLWLPSVVNCPAVVSITLSILIVGHLYRLTLEIIRTTTDGDE